MLKDDSATPDERTASRSGCVGSVWSSPASRSSGSARPDATGPTRGPAAIASTRAVRVARSASIPGSLVRRSLPGSVATCAAKASVVRQKPGGIRKPNPASRSSDAALPPIRATSRSTADRLNAARASGGRLIAVGTTSLRLLESAAGDDGIIRPFEGDTAIFITPGYRFKAVDGLVTNFHLPKSTLFMLVSALMGLEMMKTAYAHAVEGGYRFYSYGDASLLLPL